MANIEIPHFLELNAVLTGLDDFSEYHKPDYHRIGECNITTDYTSSECLSEFLDMSADSKRKLAKSLSQADDKDIVICSDNENDADYSVSNLKEEISKQAQKSKTILANDDGESWIQTAVEKYRAILEQLRDTHQNFLEFSQLITN